MARKIKMKANKKGTIQQIPQDVENSYNGTVKMDRLGGGGLRPPRTREERSC
jgi:hypothetical protein